MITIYRLFQIILGIMLSGFIFLILVNYAGDYASTGEAAARQKTIEVFLQDADSVYLNGISINFSGFSGDDYSLCYPAPSDPPIIRCFIENEEYPTRELLTPVFLRLGDGVLITRNSMDLGWTRLDYVLALADTTMVFNPLENDAGTWELMKEIVMGFPDTSNHAPKIHFDFCDNKDLLLTNYFGKPYERDEFMNMIEANSDVLGKCLKSLGDDQLLVTFSSSCTQSFAESGICIAPPTGGVGYAYITGSPYEYVYKDPLDIIALITGGERKNVFMNSLGGEAWKFKNNFMLGSIRTAAKVMERRFDISYQLPGTEQSCRDVYFELSRHMSVIHDLSQGDPGDIADMAYLKEALDDAEAKWAELINMGCERHG
jgi:hypothetical protein